MMVGKLQVVFAPPFQDSIKTQLQQALGDVWVQALVLQVLMKHVIQQHYFFAFPNATIKGHHYAT
jgi:hypothetical protein